MNQDLRKNLDNSSPSESGGFHLEPADNKNSDVVEATNLQWKIYWVVLNQVVPLDFFLDSGLRYVNRLPNMFIRTGLTNRCAFTSSY